MKIDGRVINAEVSDIIETLRDQLAEKQKYLFRKINDSTDDVMVCCPYHKDGQENNPSMGIRKSDGMCHCLACGETHTLPDMIGYCFDANALYGYKWLISNFILEEQERETLNLKFDRDTVKEEEPDYVSEEELDTYRYTHPYMYERGLTDKIIELFDIGYDKQTRSITFPIRDSSGKTLFIVRRTIRFKSFNIPRNVDKPLYGFYEIQQQAKKLGTLDKVYVCEGQFDCLKLWCNDKFAVAGFGCLYNRLQMSQLEQLPTRHIVLALDNDVAGQVAAEKLKKRVTGKMVTRVVLPKGRKDIGECTNEEIQQLEEKLL